MPYEVVSTLPPPVGKGADLTESPIASEIPKPAARSTLFSLFLQPCVHVVDGNSSLVALEKLVTRFGSFSSAYLFDSVRCVAQDVLYALPVALIYSVSEAVYALKSLFVFVLNRDSSYRAHLSRFLSLFLET